MSKSVSQPDLTLAFADTLWNAADALRGQVDAAEYKHVVLGLLFLKYISDAFKTRREALKKELEKDGIKGKQLESLLENRDEYTADPPRPRRACERPPGSDPGVQEPFRFRHQCRGGDRPVEAVSGWWCSNCSAPNVMSISSDGLLTRGGSITSGPQRLMPWRPASGGQPSLETLINELLGPKARSRRALLDRVACKSYNWVGKHVTLKTTRARVLGIADWEWSLGDLVDLLN